MPETRTLEEFLEDAREGGAEEVRLRAGDTTRTLESVRFWSFDAAVNSRRHPSAANIEPELQAWAAWELKAHGAKNKVVDTYRPGQRSEAPRAELIRPSDVGGVQGLTGLLMGAAQGGDPGAYQQLSQAYMFLILVHLVETLTNSQTSLVSNLGKPMEALGNHYQLALDRERHSREEATEELALRLEVQNMLDRLMDMVEGDAEPDRGSLIGLARDLMSQAGLPLPKSWGGEKEPAGASTEGDTSE